MEVIIKNNQNLPKEINVLELECYLLEYSLDNMPIKNFDIHYYDLVLSFTLNDFNELEFNFTYNGLV